MQLYVDLVASLKAKCVPHARQPPGRRGDSCVGHPVRWIFLK